MRGRKSTVITTPQAAYESFEPAFLWDYLGFANDLRDYVALQISEGAQWQNSTGKHLAFLTVFGALMAGFEDIAALLLALKRRYSTDPQCRYQRECRLAATPVAYTLLNYRDVQLDFLLGKDRPAQVYRNFYFEKLIPSEYTAASALTPATITTGLKQLAKFLCEDITRNQSKNDRPKAYNKIKHGAIVVSDATRFYPTLPVGPGVVMETSQDPSNPLKLLTLPYSDEELEKMKRIVWLSKVARKLLVSLYLWKEHRSFLNAKGVVAYSLLFDTDMLAIIQHQGPQAPPGEVH